MRWELKYFALETGTQKPLDEAVRTGTVTAATDPYSWDPQRAALLRAVLASGLKPIAIDLSPDESARMSKDPSAGIGFRESSMARHLQHILERDPDGKVFVWVGFSHAENTRGKERHAVDGDTILEKHRCRALHHLPDVRQ